MMKNIEWFKKEKITNYHKNLSHLSMIQKENSNMVNSLWQLVKSEVDKKQKQN